MSILLEVDDLKISARKDDDSLLPIVKGVSFKVERGEGVCEEISAVPLGRGARGEVGHPA